MEQAHRAYRHCLLCEHRCGVNREAGERGFCRATTAARVYRHRVEYGEELELVPSQLLYLSGCNLRCAFCIGEEDAFDPGRGILLTKQLVYELMTAGRAQGAQHVQWVGGEPTIHLPMILEAMTGCPDPLRVVWKSNFYGTIEGFALLDGMVDVYVADFKFGNDACAREIAGVNDYVRVVTRNMLLAVEKSRLIVRHLLLPGHFDCCYRPIVNWMHQHLVSIPFRIMTGYLPRWRAGRHPELAMPLRREVEAEAVTIARQKGLHVIG
ncbi:MAG TPA: radical SAM protein [Thermoguttaceae bacterium]|nr:radical SAM protein [Thermoguttaceae bacterium]